MAKSLVASQATILVVEDEPLQRMITADLIADAGYEVVGAESADIAVTILSSRTDIRVVVTDIDMPGSMDGLKLAAAVRDRWPPIEIIVVSGGTRPDGVALPDRAVFYAKPYNHQSFLKTLKQMAA